MVDSLLHQLAQAERSPILSRLGLANGGPNGSRPYAVLTLHRPSNVDHPHILRDLFLGLREVGRHLPVIFSCPSPDSPETQRAWTGVRRPMSFGDSDY
jgi:UDP-N-acetylglucosamine 2-epimerase (non-hydrolysing)